jgi:hypothetical protein
MNHVQDKQAKTLRKEMDDKLKEVQEQRQQQDLDDESTPSTPSLGG